MNQGQRFRRRALRRGYKVDEVDTFLERAEATIAGAPVGVAVTAEEVHEVVFRVRFGGYDEWQVDLYLDRIERQLAELEEKGLIGAPRELPVGPSGPRDDTMLPAPPRDDRMPAGPAGAREAVRDRAVRSSAAVGVPAPPLVPAAPLPPPPMVAVPPAVPPSPPPPPPAPPPIGRAASPPPRLPRGGLGGPEDHAFPPGPPPTADRPGFDRRDERFRGREPRDPRDARENSAFPLPEERSYIGPEDEDPSLRRTAGGAKPPGLCVCSSFEDPTSLLEPLGD